MTNLLRHLTALLSLLPAALAWPAVAAPEPSCQVRAAAAPPLVVELYTSEGCSSCPPAEAWLNTLKGRGDVLPLAFHVNYWDALGWVDRLATPEGTDRQRLLARADGQRGVYTPQVRASGQDWRHWPDLPPTPRSAGPVLQLSRQGDTYVAQVSPWPTQALAGYWAVLEDGHASRVRSGENAGATLRHDHVVRLYRPLAPWSAGEAYASRLQLPPADHPGRRRVAFVVVDTASQRPLQAATLGC